METSTTHTVIDTGVLNFYKTKLLSHSVSVFMESLQCSWRRFENTQLSMLDQDEHLVLVELLGCNN